MNTAHILPGDIAEICDRVGQADTAFSGRTILLSGARGFLGRYLMAVFAKLNEHLDAPCRVIGLDSGITSGERDEPAMGPHQQVLGHDVREPYRAEVDVDYVVHAAGIASPYYYRAYPLETLEVSTVGTRHLLELAARHSARFLFFSSSEIYGDPDPDQVPTPESYRGNVSPLGPRACYDESKRLGETLCWIFHEYSGVPAMIVRPFNIYGPGMREDDYRVIPSFASALVGGRPVQVYGSGTQTRTYCYITDAIVGFLLVLARGVPGQAYNIGNSAPEVSVLDLISYIEKAVGRPVSQRRTPHPDSYPADEPNRRCPDVRKAVVQLGYHPEVGLEDGLRRFFVWAEQAYTGQL